jgi:hypothetical protein
MREALRAATARREFEPCCPAALFDLALPAPAPLDDVEVADALEEVELEPPPTPAVGEPEGDGADTCGSDDVEGTEGLDGADGTEGAEGTDGADGTDGAEGTDGTDGVDGTDGTEGVDGRLTAALVSRPQASATATTVAAKAQRRAVRRMPIIN